MSLCDLQDVKDLKPKSLVPFSSGLVSDARSLGGGVSPVLFLAFLPPRNSLVGFVGDGGSQTFESVPSFQVPRTIVVDPTIVGNFGFNVAAEKESLLIKLSVTLWINVASVSPGVILNAGIYKLQRKNGTPPMDTYELLESIPFPVKSTDVNFIKVTKSKHLKKKICPNDTLGLFIVPTGPSASMFEGMVRVAGGLTIGKMQLKILEAMVCC